MASLQASGFNYRFFQDKFKRSYDGDQTPIQTFVRVSIMSAPIFLLSWCRDQSELVRRQVD